MTGFPTFLQSPTIAIMVAAADILLVAYLIYRIGLLIKGTRAQQALIGLTWLTLTYLFSRWIGFKTLYWILDHVIGSLFLFVVVVFQKDIRRGLSRMGTHAMRTDQTHTHTTHTLDEIVRAVEVLSKEHTGAILLIEHQADLTEWASSGIKLDAHPSASLLITLFTPGAPLHDGAVVVQHSKITAAAVFLPLEHQMGLNPTLGTRHRAAIHATEETDAIAIVVSEENGHVAYARNGTLHTQVELSALQQVLHNSLNPRKAVS